jgi:4-amino-4-deoxy-L-arabinose transferase-like glycosyltransferase
MRRLSPGDRGDHRRSLWPSGCRSPHGSLPVSSPVFLISASHVMCDVMLLDWTWAIHFWIAGLDRGKWPLLLVSAVLITGAMLTKYFGVSLFPAPVYTLMRERGSPSPPVT